MLNLVNYYERENSMLVRNAKDFGQVLRDRRRALGYTQTQVAQACGVSLMFISDLERGKPTAQLEKALRVAHLLGCDLDVTGRG